MSRFIRDNQHMTVHHLSRRHNLTPALKANRWIRAECLLQWHTENGEENIHLMDEKIFNIEEQYNHQSNKIYVQTSREVKENVLRVHGGHQIFYIMVWWVVSHQGVTHFHFCKKEVKMVSKCSKRICYGEL